MRKILHILLAVNLFVGVLCQAQPVPDAAFHPEDSTSVHRIEAPDVLSPADTLQDDASDSLHEMVQDLVLQTFHERIERLVMAGEFEQALAVSDTTLYLAETPENYYYQGVVNECLSAWRQAEWAYSKAIRLNPACQECYLALVRVLLNLNRPEEAMTWTDRLFDLDSLQYEGLLYRSRAFAMLNEYQEAVADISQFIEIDSTRVDAYRLRAAYYMSLSQYQAAAADYDVMIRKDGRPEWYSLRADCYTAQKMYAEALRDCQEVVVMTAAKPEYLGLFQTTSDEIRRLRQLLGMQEQSAATQNFADSISKAPDSADVHVVQMPPAKEEK